MKWTSRRTFGGLHDAADHPRRHALGAQGVEEVDAGLFGGEVAFGGCSDFGEVGAQGVDPGLDLVRCAQFAGPVDAQAGDVFGDEALEVEVVAAVGEGVPDDGFGGGAVVARQLGGDETGMRHRLGLVLTVVDAPRRGDDIAVHVDCRGPVEFDGEALGLGVLDGDRTRLVVTRKGEREGHVLVGVDAVLLEGAVGVAAGAALGKEEIDVRELLRVNLSAKILDLVGDGVARGAHVLRLFGALLCGNGRAVREVEDELRVLILEYVLPVAGKRRCRGTVEVADHRLAPAHRGAVQLLELPAEGGDARRVLNARFGANGRRGFVKRGAGMHCESVQGQNDVNILLALQFRFKRIGDFLVRGVGRDLEIRKEDRHEVGAVELSRFLQRRDGVEVLHHARAENCADALVDFRFLIGHIVARGELV